MGDAQVGHLFKWVGHHPVLTEGVLEKGKQDAASVVKGLRLGVAAVAVGGEGVAGERGQRLALKRMLQGNKADADVFELAGGEQAAFVLQLFGGEVGGGGRLHSDLAFGGAVVGERVL